MIVNPWLYFFVSLFSIPNSQLCENRPETCTQESDPVCAAVPCPPYMYCVKDYNNPCLACQNTEVIGYRPGTCDTPGGPHQAFPKNVNKYENAPICSFYEIADYGAGAQDMKDNADVKHIPMLFYIKGECKDKDKTVCQKGDRDQVCDGIEKPVCAYSFNTKPYPGKITKRQTKGNSCEACKDTSVDFYVNGACKDSNVIAE